MGFNMLFYIIFGTNLLTKGPVQIVVFFAYFSVSQKRNTKRSPNGIKLSWWFFLDRHPGDLEWKSEDPRGGHKGGGRAPQPYGPLAAPPTYFFRLYILIYPENIQEHHETLFPPQQPSVPVTSHLGAFFGAPPQGESITEGFYINTIASLMMCE